MSRKSAPSATKGEAIIRASETPKATAACFRRASASRGNLTSLRTKTMPERQVRRKSRISLY